MASTNPTYNMFAKDFIIQELEQFIIDLSANKTVLVSADTKWLQKELSWFRPMTCGTSYGSFHTSYLWNKLREYVKTKMLTNICDYWYQLIFKPDKFGKAPKRLRIEYEELVQLDELPYIKCS